MNDSDPQKNSAARRHEILTWKEYRTIIGSHWVPGMHAPFDPTASRLAQKNKLSVFFMGGDSLGDLSHILHGEKWNGSVIRT